MPGNLVFLFFQSLITITYACYLFGMQPAVGTETTVMSYGPFSSSVVLKRCQNLRKQEKFLVR